MNLAGKSQNTDCQVAPDKRRRFRRVSVLPRKAKTKDLLLLTELLRQLAACHVPILEGLVRTAADCPNNQVSMHLNRLAEHMKAGETLSGAMRQSPKFFPRYYVDLVAMAENSDQLAGTLSGLIYEVQSRWQAGHMARNRSAYIVTLIAYVVFVSSLLSNVFQSLEQDFVDVGGQVRGPSNFARHVMAYTGFLSGPLAALSKAQGGLFGQSSAGDNGSGFLWGSPVPRTALSVLLGGALVAAVFVMGALLLSKPCGFLFGRLPGVRRILLYAQWGHALRILSLFLARGTPLDRALESAAGSDVQGRVRSALRRLGDRVRSGQALSEALNKEGWNVPSSLRTAVAFGEHAGCLEKMLSDISHAYALRAERAMRMVMNILFPLAVIGCGVLVSAVHIRLFSLMSMSIDSLLSQI